VSGGRWTEARRDGRCAHCKTPFLAGAEIYGKSAGVWLCYDCGTLAENVPGDVGTIEASVMKELSKLPLEAGEGMIAQAMLSLARDLDDGDVPPRERTQYTKELRLNLVMLQDAYPAGEEDDDTDDARRRRERRARAAGEE
jgi:hypothetical protein